MEMAKVLLTLLLVLPSAVLAAEHGVGAEAAEALVSASSASVADIVKSDEQSSQQVNHLNALHDNIGKIFMLCVVMYGAIGLLWALYWQLPKDDPRISYFRVGLLCVSWASMSIGMHVLNKSLASSLHAPSLISIVQMLVAVVVMAGTSFRQLLTVDRGQLTTWLIVPIFFASMLISSFYAFEFMTLSLLTIVRNLTPLVVLPIESIVMPPEKKPKVNAWVLMAICTMLSGAIVYGGSISELKVIGIAFAVLNMVLACSDRLIQRRLLTTECSDLPSSVCTMVNNFLGMFPTLAMAFFTGEVANVTVPEAAVEGVHWTDPRMLALLLVSGLVGIGICYMGFECQREISATSFFVLQNISKVAVVCTGIFFFQDPINSPWIIVGLSLSIGGSFMYGKAQLDLAKQKEKEVDKSEKTPLVESAKQV